MLPDGAKGLDDASYISDSAAVEAGPTLLMNGTMT
jgi:hypothetical protein